MKPTLTTIVTGVACFILGAFIVHSFFPSVIVQSVAGASPAGSTFSTAKEYSVTMALTGTGTTTSIQNTDSNNRYVKNNFAFCTGLTQASSALAGSLSYTVATTSQNFTGSTTAPTTNATPAGVIAMATSTGAGYTASSTWPTPYYQIWQPGQWMTFNWNATDTAVCTVGLSTLAS